MQHSSRCPKYGDFAYPHDTPDAATALVRAEYSDAPMYMQRKFRRRVPSLPCETRWCATHCLCYTARTAWGRPRVDYTRHLAGTWSRLRVSPGDESGGGRT